MVVGDDAISLEILFQLVMLSLLLERETVETVSDTYEERVLWLSSKARSDVDDCAGGVG